MISMEVNKMYVLSTETGEVVAEVTDNEVVSVSDEEVGKEIESVYEDGVQTTSPGYDGGYLDKPVQIRRGDNSFARYAVSHLSQRLDYSVYLSSDIPMKQKMMKAADKADFPAHCRSCGERRRMSGSFVCPTCHPDVDEDEYDGALAGDADAEKDNAVTTGSSGYSNATYGGVSGTTLDYDHWESEYMDLRKAMDEEDMDYEQVDDLLHHAHRVVVEWYPDEGDDLSKAPNMWEEADNVPEFVREVIEFVIDTREIVYTSFEDLPHDAALRVKEILKEELQEPEGWSIDSLTETFAEELRVSEDKAQSIARTESGAVLNTSREVAYEASPGSDDFVYYWSGADDSRTTDLCHDIKSEVDDRGGAVPMDELKTILLDAAHDYDYGTPGRVDEWMPHWMCRHTFVRDVQL
jgi:hypothetical protein